MMAQPINNVGVQMHSLHNIDTVRGKNNLVVKRNITARGLFYGANQKR